MNQSKIQNPKSPPKADPPSATKIRNPWPIALTLVIGSAFAFATWVAFTMIRQSVDLVPEEHYQRDLMHNERMAAEQRARMLDQPVTASLTTGRAIALRFPGTNITGTIRLYRPSDAALDQVFEIAPDLDGQQIIPAQNLAAGKWELRMEWTHEGQTFAQTELLVLP